MYGRNASLRVVLDVAFDDLSCCLLFCLDFICFFSWPPVLIMDTRLPQGLPDPSSDMDQHGAGRQWETGIRPRKWTCAHTDTEGKRQCRSVQTREKNDNEMITFFFFSNKTPSVSLLAWSRKGDLQEVKAWQDEPQGSPREIMPSLYIPFLPAVVQQMFYGCHANKSHARASFRLRLVYSFEAGAAFPTVVISLYSSLRSMSATRVPAPSLKGF